MKQEPVGGGATTVRLVGDIDFRSWQDVHNMLAEVVQTGNDVVVDMSEVPFVDSAGITVLVDARRRVGQAGGGFRLVDLRPPVRRALQIMGLLEVLGVR